MARVTDHDEHGSAYETRDVPAPSDDGVVLDDDIESAYRRALEANEAFESEFDDQASALTPPEDDAPPVAPKEALGTPLEQEQHNNDGTGDQRATQRVTPREVIEAALFVGGPALTIRKLGSLFHSEFDVDLVEQTVEELNRQYLDENRPYEIRFGEGGYRLALRSEFESFRNRVFGVGPRDVKLSRDALEILALVAYNQPVTAHGIEQFGRSKPTGTLRQLIRRELVAVERTANKTSDVAYVTTPRFLSVFGLHSIDELPTADELSFK